MTTTPIPAAESPEWRRYQARRNEIAGEFGLLRDIDDPEVLARRDAAMAAAKAVYDRARAARPPEEVLPSLAERRRAARAERPAGSACGPPGEVVTGSSAGHARHRAVGEPPCGPCAAAERERIRKAVAAHRARKKAEDLEGYLAADAAASREWRARRKAADPDGYRAYMDRINATDRRLRAARRAGGQGR